MRFSPFLTGLTVCVTAGLVALLPQSGAHAQTFDFEELATTPGITPIVSTQGGVTVTITRADAGTLQITNLLLTGPWGDRTIIPSDTVGSTMIIDFSVPVSGVSILAGDLGQDDDTPITLTAFSSAGGGGAFLGSDSVNYPAASDIRDGAIASLSLSAPGILSVTLTNGGDFPGSIYYDNLVVSRGGGTNAAPEPATAALLLPLIGMAILRRRK